MSTIWGIHNDQPSLDFIDGGFVAIGWDEIGNLKATGPDRESLKARIAETYPSVKAGAIPVWAGVLMRFASEMQVGDLVIYPYRPDSTLNFGRIEGEYSWDEAASSHKSRRKVAWLRTGVPRAQFTQAARFEIGSAVTLFKVKNHAAEFMRYIEQGDEAAEIPSLPTDVEVAATTAEDAITADRIESDTRDFVISTLYSELDGYEFEYFVADLLNAMGYRTRVTQSSGDGGVDVVAHKDELGLEPPIIKVQCKKTLGTLGSPEIQKLTGTLAPGGAELGLFVSLGAFTRDAMNLGLTRHDLRLINGRDLVELVFENYERLSEKWKVLLPLRRVYVVDRRPNI